MRRMRRTAPLAAALLVALGLAAPPSGADAATASSSSSSSAPVPGCRWSHRGFDVNLWLGGSGTWSDATHWSKGVVPGTSGSPATQDYACIPHDSTVVVDSLTPRVDLEILELGLGATLKLRPGTGLFVWGDQTTIRSITKRGSLIEAPGATVGGGGRLHVIGTLDVHPSTSGRRAVLATAPAGTTYAGAPGILEIGDEGRLAVHGPRDVHLRSRYVVDVHGKATLDGQAGIRADNGTTFMLQKHYYGSGVGKLLIFNDGDFKPGAAAGIDRAPTFVNRGRISKLGPGLTEIRGRYFASHGHVGGDGGGQPFAFLIPPSFVQNTATTGTNTSTKKPQVASLLLPVTGPDESSGTVAPLPGEDVAGSVGVPMKVHAQGLVATVADPAVVELRYNLSLFDDGGPKPDPATLSIGHADGPGEKYQDVVSCEGRGLPLGATMCVDRLASRVEGNTVVMVVLTMDTSRWIAF